MYFSVDWQLIRSVKNNNEIQITFINENGICETKKKWYKDWVGVCTSDIDGINKDFRLNFPREYVTYEAFGEARKVLPYFKDRLITGKLNYEFEPFYKLYTSACHKTIGRLFKRYEIGYLDPADWLIRIYVDLCTRYNSFSFYYKWYEVREDRTDLVQALQMVPCRKDQPHWTVAAFDLEAVPLVGNHIPMGYHRMDRIVMLSIYKWKGSKIQKWLLYLLPDGVPDMDNDSSTTLAFRSESDMLVYFHSLLEDVHVLTGYNINAFDFPCIFARCLCLSLKSVLKQYASTKVGSDLVVTYGGKLTLDLYTYFKTFSGYNLPSYKLDDVAHVKLGERKIPVKATGLWSWYRNPKATELIESSDVEKCFEVLKPETVHNACEFGTFRTYMDYCLKDSELVYRMFEKEHVLSFLVERANFTALSAVEALHFGNSRYLLELIKSYGMRLGYFANPSFFDPTKYVMPFDGYQGALNYCVPNQAYTNVSVMDFASMYPSALVSSNLCYGTCTIMTRDQWSSNEAAQKMTAIPYRHHTDNEFRKMEREIPRFSYPTFDPNSDQYVIVVNTRAKAFLPEIVKHFISMRQFHQKMWKDTKDIYHYNIQLGIKILINSLYGVMANKDSVLAYFPIAMTITNLSRYQLLGSFHYLKSRNYNICYADTDSLMVEGWEVDNCNEINNFLSIPFTELKYEQRMERLFVLSKKRYVYETGEIVTKGFLKKMNGLVKFMTDKILKGTWEAIFSKTDDAASRGWVIWVETILEADYRCRDPRKYSIYRKVKNLEEYKSKNCPSVKYLRKYPDKNQEYIEFTYSRMDSALEEASNGIVDVEDCQFVNFEQLFVNQKKIFCMLLNKAYWNLSDPYRPANMVLNTVHWKKLVLVELAHYHATGRRLALLVEPCVKYTFHINDHLTQQGDRKSQPVVLFKEDE